MPSRLTQLNNPARKKARSDSWVWREWCFVRVVFRRFWVRVLMVIVILLGGGLLFQRLEAEDDLVVQGTYEALNEVKRRADGHVYVHTR